MTGLQLFTQVGLDSGALTLLGSVAHQLRKPGRYAGVVLVDDVETGDFSILVRDEGAMQLSIDLAAVTVTGSGGGIVRKLDEGGPLRAGGYLLLHVGSGDGRYAAVITDASEESSEVVFDSRRLEAPDVFAATVLRPGRYSVTNVENDAKAALEVAYPEPVREPYRPAEPVHIQVGRVFEPRNVKAGPAQQQIYTAGAAARVRIELVEPYDRSPEPERPRYRRSHRPR